MLKKSTAWSVLIYGIVLICLGFYGYYDKGSLVSLYMGAGLGVLLIVSATLIYFHFRWGAYMALALTLLLTATFAYRYSATTAAIPAVLSVISGGMLLFLLAQAGTWKK